MYLCTSWQTNSLTALRRQHVAKRLRSCQMLPLIHHAWVSRPGICHLPYSGSTFRRSGYIPGSPRVASDHLREKADAMARRAPCVPRDVIRVRSRSVLDCYIACRHIKSGRPRLRSSVGRAFLPRRMSYYTVRFPYVFYESGRIPHFIT